MKYAHSYGRITTVTSFSRVRHLPPGSVAKVAIDQPVGADEVIAAAEVPDGHRLIRAAERLKVPPEGLEKRMHKRVGDMVERGEVIASRPGFLGIGGRKVVSPVDGMIARITAGKVIIEAGRRRVEVRASVQGKVKAISPDRGQIMVETTGTLIQAAWGYGDLSAGTLVTMDTYPGLNTDPNRFNVDHRGAIVAIGSPLTEMFLKGAVEIRVKGIIAASVHASLMPIVKLMDFPVVLTQGFGHLPMNQRILNLLNTYAGRVAVIDVTREADWRKKRPEIIIPLETSDAPKEREGQREIKVGDKIRILQAPYVGEIGVIKSIPDELHRLPGGLWLEGVMAEVSEGETVFVPLANMEYLG